MPILHDDDDKIQPAGSWQAERFEVASTTPSDLLHEIHCAAQNFERMAGAHKKGARACSTGDARTAYMKFVGSIDRLHPRFLEFDKSPAYKIGTPDCAIAREQLYGLRQDLSAVMLEAGHPRTAEELMVGHETPRFHSIALLNSLSDCFLAYPHEMREMIREMFTIIEKHDRIVALPLNLEFDPAT